MEADNLDGQTQAGGRQSFFTISHILLKELQTEHTDLSVTSPHSGLTLPATCISAPPPAILSSLMVIVKHRVVTAMSPGIQGSEHSLSADGLVNSRTLYIHKNVPAQGLTSGKIQNVESPHVR